MQRRGKADIDAKKPPETAQLGNIPEGKYVIISQLKGLLQRLTKVVKAEIGWCSSLRLPRPIQGLKKPLLSRSGLLTKRP